MRAVFVNPERCIGCLQCEIACAVEHSEGQDESTAFLETPMPRKRVHVEAGPVPTTAYPNRCRHCDPAPCQRVCPTGAITRDDAEGLVLVDAGRCIGCAMCAVVCPFDVITFHPLAGGYRPDSAVAVKCDGCEERVRQGVEPACAEVCKVDALVYGDINELVASGRVRESGAVLAAAGVTPTELPGGDPLAGLHAWGHARLQAAVSGSTAWQQRWRTGREPRPDDGANGKRPNEDTTREGGTP
jgi:carbon-monoxide dehydrogenase iron sulfur subunit